ncbi:YwdI family protein [Jeotgalibacillus marinus]|uniref:YwdI family protein n=1 Tax=Jeotgalibacillus marinus TaxID=86667 RepID=A0ABV3Q0N7_9BACL
MSISYEQLLMKIEQEVGQAKLARSSQMREHLHSIRTLCDLALEDQGEGKSLRGMAGQELGRIQSNVVGNVQSANVYQPPEQPTVSVPRDKPMKMDDGSNGDSLFDF